MRDAVESLHACCDEEPALAVGEVGGDGGDDAEVVVGGGKVDRHGLLGRGWGRGDVDLHVFVYFEAGVGGDAEVCDEGVRGICRC